MGLWCKRCGAYVGDLPSLTDWTADSTVICVRCAKEDPRLGPETVGAIIKEEHKQRQPKAADHAALAHLHLEFGGH